MNENPLSAGMTYAKLGRIMLTEAGEDACREGYGTTDPAIVGRLALGYGDINEDGELN
jgi:hypothetical protein